MNMNKKFLLIITLVLAATVFCQAQAKPEGKKVPRTAINALINDYRHHDEFESINLGKFMTYLVKKAGAVMTIWTSKKGNRPGLLSTR